MSIIATINRVAIITTINRVAIITTINRVAIITTINRIAIITTINRIAIITTINIIAIITTIHIILMLSVLRAKCGSTRFHDSSVGRSIMHPIHGWTPFLLNPSLCMFSGSTLTPSASLVLLKSATASGAREETGDDLQYIDFHQLQIENQQFVQRIEEANQEHIIDHTIS